MINAESSIVKNILHYAFSQYFRQFLNVITAFIRPALLGPDLFGLWNLFKPIETYADYLHLGAFSSMRYQIPLHESKAEYTIVNSIKGSVFWGSFFLYLMFGAVLLFCSFTPGITAESRAGFITFAFVILLIWYYNFHLALLKAHGQFLEISRLNYIYYISVFILNIILIYFWGIYGAYLSILIPLLLIAFILKKQFSFGTMPAFERKIFTGMIKQGFPIMLYNTAAFFIRTCDRFIVAFFLGTRELGYYGVAILIMGFLLNIPGASRDVLDPHMMNAFSKSSPEKIISQYFIIPLMNTAYFMPVLIACAYFCLPEAIAIVLPQYAQGILPAQIVTIGGYFIALSYTVRGIIVANQWQNHAPIALIFPIGVNVVLSIALIKTGFGIAGVAVGSTVSYFFLVLSLFVFVSLKEKKIARQLWANAIYLILPFMMLISSICILEACVKLPMIYSFVEIFLKMVVFSLIFVILIYKTKDKHSLMQQLDFDKILKKVF